MIAICPNPYRDIDLKLTDKVSEILKGEGFETCIYKVFCDNEFCFDDVSLAVVIGGDGTMLRVAGEIYSKNIPLLGVNLGTKGFMTSLEPEDIDKITNISNGEYTVSERMMLNVYLNSNYVGTCLNDAVIHGYGDCISLSVNCNDTRMYDFSGDGIIISTPTGSTGYSMSAGGPVVEPESKCIVVSPICPHSLGSRSFVLNNTRKIGVETVKLQDRKAYLSLDGNINVDLNNHDLITAEQSEYTIKMVSLGDKSFYEKAFEKLI